MGSYPYVVGVPAAIWARASVGRFCGEWWIGVAKHVVSVCSLWRGRGHANERTTRETLWGKVQSMDSVCGGLGLGFVERVLRMNGRQVSGR